MGPDRDLSAKWHHQVEGIWHGMPAVYDAAGGFHGCIQADRAIYLDDAGRPLIRVKTDLSRVTGPLRQRLEHDEHLLRVAHLEDKRVYEGPDFYGAGYPYGSLILGNDYCVPWLADNRVGVQLLPDGERQAYSTILFEGPAMLGIIVGLYRQTKDYADNPQTRRDIAAFREAEVAAATSVYGQPAGRSVWTGNLEVRDGGQKKVSHSQARLERQQQSHFRWDNRLQLEGGLTCSYAWSNARHEGLWTCEGDLWGNGRAWGRALYSTLHVRSETRRLKTREFLLDGGRRLAVILEFYRAEEPEYVVHGLLEREEEGAGV